MNSTLNEFIEKFNHATSTQKKSINNNVFALLIYKSELDLNISQHYNKYVNTIQLFFTDPQLALHSYANIPNPESQLISAQNLNELYEKIISTNKNMNNEKWVIENIIPFI